MSEELSRKIQFPGRRDEPPSRKAIVHLTYLDLDETFDQATHKFARVQGYLPSYSP